MMVSWLIEYAVTPSAAAAAAAAAAQPGRHRLNTRVGQPSTNQSVADTD